MQPQRQTLSWGQYSHPGPPCYNPTLSARSGPDPLGGYCHPSHNGWQTGENPCSLPLSFPPTDRGGPDRLIRRGFAGPAGRRPQRQTRGLELTAEHETEKTLTRLRRQALLSDPWAGRPHHLPITLQRYSQCPGQRDGEGLSVPGLSDLVLCA